MKTKRTYRCFSWLLLPIAWMALIYWFSDQPVLAGFELYLADFLLKKTAHLLIYAGLFWSWWRVIRECGWSRRPVAWATIIVLCLAYACFDEWHQSWTPTRMATARDVAVDMVGVTMAALWTGRWL